MVGIKGFVDGNSVVASDDSLGHYDGKDAIIIILDTFHSIKEKVTSKKKKYTADDIKDAFGLWKNHEDSEDVSEYVRSLRKGRNIGI